MIPLISVNVAMAALMALVVSGCHKGPAVGKDQAKDAKDQAVPVEVAAISRGEIEAEGDDHDPRCPKEGPEPGEAVKRGLAQAHARGMDSLALAGLTGAERDRSSIAS